MTSDVTSHFLLLVPAPHFLLYVQISLVSVQSITPLWSLWSLIGWEGCMVHFKDWNSIIIQQERRMNTVWQREKKRWIQMVKVRCGGRSLLFLRRDGKACPAEKRFNYLYYVLYYHNMYVSLRWWIRRRLEFKCFWRDFNLKIVYMPPQKISQYLLISCYFYKYQYHWLSLNWHIHISCFVQSAVEAQIMLLFLSSFAFVFSSLFCVLDLFHSFFSICHFPFYHFYLYWLINFLCSDISVVSSLTQTRLQSVQLDCLVFIL